MIRKILCSAKKVNWSRVGYFVVTFKQTKAHNPEHLFIHTRMAREVTPILINLFYSHLSQGSSIQNLEWSFKMGKETAYDNFGNMFHNLGKIISNLCVGTAQRRIQRNKSCLEFAKLYRRDRWEVYCHSVPGEARKLIIKLQKILQHRAPHRNRCKLRFYLHWRECLWK